MRNFVWLSVFFGLLVPACRKGAPASLSTSGAASTPVAPPSAPAPGEWALDVRLESSGARVFLRGVELGGDCAKPATSPSSPAVSTNGDGGVDAEALGRCVRTLREAHAASTDALVSLTASPEIPYATVITALGAVKADAKGELFPDVRLRPPVGMDRPSVPAGLPAPADAAGKSDSALVIALSKTQMIVGDEPVIHYDLAQLGDKGLPAVAKPRGAADFFIGPLNAALVRLPRSESGIVIVSDTSVPYRVLYEVIFTAEASGYSKYQLLSLKKAP